MSLCLYARPVASRYSWTCCDRDGDIVVVGVVHDGDAEQAQVSARQSAQKRFGGVEKRLSEICFAGGEPGAGRAVYPNEKPFECGNDAAIGV